MIPINILYEALLTILPNDYTLNFSYLDITEPTDDIDVSKNIGAMYFRSAGVQNDRDITTGKYMQEQTRLVINLLTDRGEQGVLDGLDYCKRACDILDSTFNKEIVLEDNKVVTIIDCIRLGGYQYVGQTKQGIASFSINYLIKYN